MEPRVWVKRKHGLSTQAQLENRNIYINEHGHPETSIESDPQ